MPRSHAAGKTAFAMAERPRDSPEWHVRQPGLARVLELSLRSWQNASPLAYQRSPPRDESPASRSKQR